MLYKYEENAKKFNISANLDSALGSNTKYINDMIDFLRKTDRFKQI